MLLTILRIAASNAISVTLLAAVVFAISLVVNRPALTRALWVLVLIKLLTPPFWTISISDFIAYDLPPQSGDRHQSRPAESTSVVANAENLRPTAIDETQIANADTVTPAFDTTSEIENTQAAMNTPSVLQTLPLPELITAAWAVGIACCFIAVVLRVRRFAKCARLADRAPPSVQGRCATLAAQLGLREAPEILFVPSAICPSLWAFGRRPRVIIPQALWNRLDSTQQNAVVLHELAHLRRRDHWVRLLEVATTLFYWWHPIVWLARRWLHEAEEQCCDACVVGILPGAARRYAAALLETVDFLSLPHPATPALASGLGEFSRLKRRIVMIQNGRVRNALSWSGAIVVFALASVVLPVTAGFGQAGPDKEAKPDNAPDRPPTNKQVFERVYVVKDLAVNADDGKANEVKVFQGPVDTAGDKKADGDKSETQKANLETEQAIKKAHLEVEQLSAEMAKLQAALAQAKARLGSLEKARAGGYVRSVTQDDIKAAKKLWEKKAAKYADDVNADKADFVRWSIVSRADASPDERLDRLEKQVKSILAEIHEMKGQKQEPAKP